MCKENGRDGVFASCLRMYRAKADLSQEKLAEMIGTHITSIQNWESGDHMPTLRTTIKVADALGCTLDQLVGRA